jgi:hypothetical protein
MIETIMVKRKAHYRGEIGFFPAGEVFEQDIAAPKMDEQLIVKYHSHRRIEALRYLWGLVHLVADNTNRYLDKDEAMLDLKLRAGYVRVLTDENGKLELRPKSLTRISDEELRLLTAKIQDIICAKILPDMRHDELRREVEEMIEIRREKKEVQHAIR